MKRLVHCLSHKLTQIYTKTTEISSYSAKVKKHLPEELRQHCKVSNVENGCITISVDNPTFATLLRYEIPTLLKKLRTEEKMYSLRSVKHKINPHTQSKNIETELPKLNLTEKSCQAINETAHNCKDEHLKKALSHLSDTIKKRIKTPYKS